MRPLFPSIAFTQACCPPPHPLPNKTLKSAFSASAPINSSQCGRTSNPNQPSYHHSQSLSPSFTTPSPIPA
ncbi:hypothetical protein B0H10DRAFT_2019437, partial [Mycena sp. CBHHK59/15]